MYLNFLWTKYKLLEQSAAIYTTYNNELKLDDVLFTLTQMSLKACWCIYKFLLEHFCNCFYEFFDKFRANPSVQYYIKQTTGYIADIRSFSEL